MDKTLKTFPLGYFLILCLRKQKPKTKHKTYTLYVRKHKNKLSYFSTII